MSLKPTSGKLLRNGINGPELTGTVTNVYVHGKVIIVETDNNVSLVSTLGMSGWWYPSAKQLSPEQARQRAHYNNVEVETGTVISAAERHTRAQIICTDGTILNYVDTRNFGNLYVTDKNGVINKLNGLGPDLLNNPPSESTWCQTWQDKKHANKQIGSALLEQNIFCGLGNIYRAETCYLAGVDPFAKVCELTNKQLVNLYHAAIHVLAVAYEMGTTANPTSVGYSLKVFKALMPSTRFDPLMLNLIERTRKSEQEILERGYYGKLMVYGQQISPINEPVIRSSLGGRTIWFVK